MEEDNKHIAGSLQDLVSSAKQGEVLINDQAKNLYLYFQLTSHNGTEINVNFDSGSEVSVWLQHIIGRMITAYVHPK